MDQDSKLLTEVYKRLYTKEPLKESDEEFTGALRPDTYYRDQLYVRAKGANRYAGGSKNWLRIRRIERVSDKDFVVYVQLHGMEKGVDINLDIGTPNLDFKVRGMPATFGTVLMHYFGLTRNPKTWSQEFAALP